MVVFKELRSIRKRKIEKGDQEECGRRSYYIRKKTTKQQKLTQEAS